jgi:dipeptidase E
MPKYYLLGGENIHKRDAKYVNQKAFNDSGENPKIIVLSWARASFDKKYLRSKRLFDYFRSLGASKVNFLDYSNTPSEIKEQISNSNIVYLTGGVPSILIERLKKLDIDNQLKSYEGVIVGRSAGALALCRKCVITYRSNSEDRIINGLGLVDLTLKAHYRLGVDDKLKELSKIEDIFAAPKSSALIYDNGTLSFINNIYLFHNGERQTLS